MESIPDMGAKLLAMVIEHPEPASISKLYRSLGIDRPPTVMLGNDLRYRATIETPHGARRLV